MENQRIKTLKKKTLELSTLCGVDAAIIIYPGAALKKPQTWPEDPRDLRRILNRFREDKDLGDCGGGRRKRRKTEEVRADDDHDLMMEKEEDSTVNGLSAEQVQEVLGLVDSKLSMVNQRIQELKNNNNKNNKEAEEEEEVIQCSSDIPPQQFWATDPYYFCHDVGDDHGYHLSPPLINYASDSNNNNGNGFHFENNNLGLDQKEEPLIYLSDDGFQFENNLGFDFEGLQTYDPMTLLPPSDVDHHGDLSSQTLINGLDLDTNHGFSFENNWGFDEEEEYYWSLQSYDPLLLQQLLKDPQFQFTDQPQYY